MKLREIYEAQQDSGKSGRVLKVLYSLETKIKKILRKVLKCLMSYLVVVFLRLYKIMYIQD